MQHVIKNTFDNNGKLTPAMPAGADVHQWNPTSGKPYCSLNHAAREYFKAWDISKKRTIAGSVPNKTLKQQLVEREAEVIKVAKYEESLIREAANYEDAVIKAEQRTKSLKGLSLEEKYLALELPEQYRAQSRQAALKPDYDFEGLISKIGY